MTSTITLRDSTLLQRQEMESKPISYSYRRSIPVAQAATRLQIPHHCNHDSDMGIDKMQRRVAGLFIRFAVTQFFGCTTSRVSTDMQAGRSHCGNCECAHWATTSAMRDDKMPRVLTDITNGDELTPKRELYLKRRLNLNTPDKENFEALEASAEKVKFVRDRITPQDLHNSFYMTAYAKQLSSTLEGPTAANDLDQSLESKLRPYEDQLSNEIHAETLDYKEATRQAFDKLLDLLETATTNLRLRMTQIELYHSLECELDLIESRYSNTKTVTTDQVDHYTKSVTKTIDLRKKILTKLPHACSFKQVNFDQVSFREDFFWLKSFAATMQALEDGDERMKEFELHMDRITKGPLQKPKALENARIRLQEAEAQLEGLNNLGLCNVGSLDKWLFGVNEKGVRRAPTDEELYEQLVAMTAKEQPISRKKPQQPSQNTDDAPEVVDIPKSGK